MRLPFLGRLSPREYGAVIIGFGFVLFESLLRVVIFLLPTSVIQYCYTRSRLVFKFFWPKVTSRTRGESVERKIAHQVQHARDFEELCRIFDYTHEEHVVLTKDGYMLGLHRLPAKKGDSSRSMAGRSTGKPVVYLHHGLLMNSEVWVCLTDEQRAVPFVLVEQGYDVWLGNNRGNKYSKKSIHHRPDSVAFWNFSIDDFAWRDIPDSIEYILDITKVDKLSYVGFSQGTAQAFAALSIHPQLNDKINVFIALAPAISPPGLSASIVDALMKASPTLVYLVFGRKSILSSAIMWQSILYPPIFSSLIDASLTWLFNWQSLNISQAQKLAAYAHLYSYASVKSVVHWFQIMRHSEFLMFDDEVRTLSLQASYQTPSLGSSSPPVTRGVTGYKPVRFPTENIVAPIVVFYGDADSLINIDVLRNSLPAHTIITRLHGYEHLDVIWGRDVDQEVIPHVLKVLAQHSGRTDSSALDGSSFLDVQRSRIGFDEKVSGESGSDDF